MKVKITEAKILTLIITFVSVFVFCSNITMSLKVDASAGGDNAAENKASAYDFENVVENGVIYAAQSLCNKGAVVGLNGKNGAVCGGLIGAVAVRGDKSPGAGFGGRSSSGFTVYEAKSLHLYQGGGVDHAGIANYQDQAKAMADQYGIELKKPGQKGDGAETYHHFGFILSEMGYDEINVGSKNSLRLVAGSAMLIVYVLSTSLEKFFEMILDFLQKANPFKLIQGVAMGGTGLGSFMDKIVKHIAGYYELFQKMGRYTLLVALVSIVVLIWALSSMKNHDPGGTFVAKFKNVGIRALFIIAGVPILANAYDFTISNIEKGEGGVGMDGSGMILTTFLDFEDWVYRDALALPKEVAPAYDENTQTITDDTAGKIREWCAKLNNYRVRGASGSGVEFDQGVYVAAWEGAGAANRENRAKCLSLLQGYARCSFVDSGAYANRVMTEVAASGSGEAMNKASANWTLFDPLVVAQNFVNLAGNVSDEHKDDIGSEIQNYVDNASHRFCGGEGTWVNTKANIWTTGYSGSGGELKGKNQPKCKGLCGAAMYNYLNSKFDAGQIVVYSATGANEESKVRHYSVSLVGTTYTKWINWLDVFIMMGCSVILGYAYGFGLIVANFKAFIKVIPSVFTGLLGSLKGIVQSMAICFVLCGNIVFTLFLYDVACDILKGIFDFTMEAVKAVKSSLNGAAAGGSYFWDIAATFLSMAIMIGVTAKLIQYRKVILTAFSEAVTSALNKIFQTQAAAPNLVDNGGGGLSSAAGLATGIGLAAATGAFDGLGSKLGITGDAASELSNSADASDSLAGESVSNSDTSSSTDSSVSDASSDNNVDSNSLAESATPSMFDERSTDGAQTNAEAEAAMDAKAASFEESLNGTEGASTSYAAESAQWRGDAPSTDKTSADYTSSNDGALADGSVGANTLPDDAVCGWYNNETGNFCPGIKPEGANGFSAYETTDGSGNRIVVPAMVTPKANDDSGVMFGSWENSARVGFNTDAGFQGLRLNADGSYTPTVPTSDGNSVPGIVLPNGGVAYGEFDKAGNFVEGIRNGSGDFVCGRVTNGGTGFEKGRMIDGKWTPGEQKPNGFQPNGSSTINASMKPPVFNNNSSISVGGANTSFQDRSTMSSQAVMQSINKVQQQYADQAARAARINNLQNAPGVPTSEVRKAKDVAAKSGGYASTGQLARAPGSSGFTTANHANHQNTADTQTRANSSRNEQIANGFVDGVAGFGRSINGIDPNNDNGGNS